jgi:hypothetical protein
MSLEKRKVLGHIEVQADGVIFVKEYNQILDDGVVISSIPHRTPLNPGDAVPFDYPMVQEAAALHWKPQVIEAFKRKQAEQNKPKG